MIRTSTWMQRQAAMPAAAAAGPGAFGLASHGDASNRMRGIATPEFGKTATCSARLLGRPST